MPAFKRSSKLSGTAQLLTAEAFEGQSGGAWMDVSLYYDTPSEAADQMRLYKDKLFWAGGEPVKLADFAASVVSCADRVTQYNRGGYYGRAGYGFGGYDGYGYRGRHGYSNTYRPRYPYGSGGSRGSSRTPSSSGSIGDALSRAVTDVSAAQNTPRTAPTTRRAPSSTSRATPRPTPRATPRPTARSTPRATPTRSTSRSTARTAPRPNRAARGNRQNVKLEFQNGDLATKAAGQQASLSTSRRRLDPISPFGLGYSRGYNYGNYIHGAYGYPGADYVVTSACGRQERLRIFVPQSRLAEAERYGLVLFARAKSGDAQTLTLSPNYVTAFQMARGGRG